jgi:hypothetical protein
VRQLHVDGLGKLLGAECAVAAATAGEQETSTGSTITHLCSADRKRSLSDQRDGVCLYQKGHDDVNASVIRKSGKTKGSLHLMLQFEATPGSANAAPVPPANNHAEQVRPAA